MITFQDIAVCYKARERYPVNAIEKIDLHIAPGEWVFLVGPSGAGKSTLLKLVYHGHGAEALHGRITVDGQDVTHLKPHDIALLRRKVGVVFQDFQLLTQKTVWENVAFALQVIGTPQSRQVKDVPRALETVGLTHKAHAYPAELSGGEQQRVAIARAIVNNPTVLLADEPTGNLDPQTAADIAEVLRRINSEGTTILMATHDRNLVDEMRQRVVRIAGGQIVSDERGGVYHPEDGDLSTLSRTPVEAEDEIHPLDDAAPGPGFATPSESRPEISATPGRTAPGRATPGRREAAEASVSESATTERPTAPQATGPRPAIEQQPALPYSEPPEPPEEPIASRPAIPEPLTLASPSRTAGQAERPDAPRTYGAESHSGQAPAPPSFAAQDVEKSVEQPTQRVDPQLPDYVADTLENRAPLGSPDNPIVQMDRR